MELGVLCPIFHREMRKKNKDGISTVYPRTGTSGDIELSDNIYILYKVQAFVRSVYYWQVLPMPITVGAWPLGMAQMSIRNNQVLWGFPKDTFFYCRAASLTKGFVLQQNQCGLKTMILFAKWYTIFHGFVMKHFEIDWMHAPGTRVILYKYFTLGRVKCFLWYLIHRSVAYMRQ